MSNASAARLPGDHHRIEVNGIRLHRGAGPDQSFAHVSMRGATEDGTMADWSGQVTDEASGHTP